MLLLLPSEWPGFFNLDGGLGLVPDICVEVDVTNNPRNPVRVWTNITSQIRQLNYVRSGRSDERGRTEVGTLNALCNDRGDAVTSLGIGKAQWIRVRALWNGVVYPRWQGIFQSLPRRWPEAGKDAVIEFRAVDALYVARLYDLVGQTFALQRNHQRVSAIAALAGMTTGSLDVDTDFADAVSTPLGEGSDALSTLQEIEQSENGLLIADPSGSLSFQGRHWRLVNSAVAAGTFGEHSTEIPYRDDVTREDDDARIANIVAVTPNGGAPIIREDAASQDRYFKRRLSRTLLTSDTAIAASAAEYLLRTYKNPSPRIPGITVQFGAAAKRDPAMVATLLAANNSTRFTWTRQATTPLSEDAYVEQIGETIAPGPGWEIKYQLSPAADTPGWVLGDATNSLLGQTTALVY